MARAALTPRRTGRLHAAGRRTNLALLAVLSAALLTGTLAFATGGAWARPVVVAHGIAGVAVAVLAPWKAVVVRRGLRRARAGRAASLALAALVVAALAAGVAHAAGVRFLVAGVTAMQLHVGAALLAVPLAAWHVVARPARPGRTDWSRRNALRAGGLAGAAAVGWLATEGAFAASGASGAGRRATGSHETGSGDPAAMPVTQWLFDTVPDIDVPSWRLRVGDRILDAAALAAYGDRVRATLDCTGGWYATQDWTGARLDRLLGDPGDARSIAVRSVTGYTRLFPLRDRTRLLVATAVAGAPLSPGHGSPARLVAPGRRGFWWVKWVESISFDARPWWLQPPFPPR